MKTLRTLLLSALCLLPLAAAAQYSPVTKVYLKLTGIVGDSQDAGHVGEIEITTAAFGLNQTALSVAGGAGAPARSQFTPITILKAADKTSPLLFLNCALGKAVTTAKVTFRNVAPPQPYDYLTLEMSTVFISSFNVECATGDAAVAETVGLTYGAMKVTFQPVTPSGTLGTPISSNFSVTKNKPLSDFP